jgi:hypothetical protein
MLTSPSRRETGDYAEPEVKDRRPNASSVRTSRRSASSHLSGWRETGRMAVDAAGQHGRGETPQGALPDP